jgi:RimJ/RimL family protein N-acetyltransferase
MVRIEWQELVALEPTPEEVRAHADALAVGYNEPRNATMMGHTAEMAPDEIAEHYAEMAARGAHQFLLFADGVLAGDADLRGIADGACEFAFMIAAPSAQGKGLGTRFATMIYAFAFEHLQLQRVYASVIPENTASLRVFEKLGCTVDESPAARAFADEPGDIVMVIEREAFGWPTALGEFRILSRAQSPLL